MPVCIKGNLENKKYKLNSYQKETQNIISEYLNDNQKNNLEDYLRNCANTFKKINLIIARAQIECIRYDRANYPANLENNAIKQKLQFFSSIIGFIDGLIDNYNHDIAFFLNFNQECDKERVKNDRNKQNDLLKIRNEILKNFNDIETYQVPQICEETLNMYPSYKNFSNLYEQIAKDYISSNFQITLTTAYGIGYEYAYFSDQTEKILSIYKELLEDMKKYQISIKSEIKNEKRKKLTK